jgi:hypothetical protein
MKNDYLKLTEPELDLMENNFTLKFPNYFAGFGFTALEKTALLGVISDHRSAYGTMAAKKAEAKSAVETNHAKKILAEEAIRKAVKRMKSQPSYTAAIGKELMIVGAEFLVEWSKAKPTLKLKIDGKKVVVDFDKAHSDGVAIYCRRQGETDFSFLAIDTRPPYYDTHENSDKSKAEKREYYAFYIMNDEEVGQRSDVAIIAVGSDLANKLK